MKPFEKASNSPPRETCAAQVMETIPLIMGVLRAEMRSHRSPDLSVPQFRALNYVSRRSGASLSDVAEHVGLSLPSMSRLVEKLVARDLITRQSAPDDRRRITLALTQTGLATLLAARQATLARLVADLAALSPDECATVAEAMHILRRAFVPEESAESQERP